MTSFHRLVWGKGLSAGRLIINTNHVIESLGGMYVGATRLLPDVFHRFPDVRQGNYGQG